MLGVTSSTRSSIPAHARFLLRVIVFLGALLADSALSVVATGHGSKFTAGIYKLFRSLTLQHAPSARVAEQLKIDWLSLVTL
jgi:hypothetical protein